MCMCQIDNSYLNSFSASDSRNAEKKPKKKNTMNWMIRLFRLGVNNFLQADKYIGNTDIII